MSKDFTVLLSVDEALERLNENIFDKGFNSGKLVDQYLIKSSDDKKCAILTFERKQLCAETTDSSITISLDDFNGQTKVHCVACVSSEGIFKNSREALENIVLKVLCDDDTLIPKDTLFQGDTFNEVTQILEDKVDEVKEKAQKIIDNWSKKNDDGKKKKDYKKMGL